MLARWWQRIAHPGFVSLALLVLLVFPVFTAGLHRPDPGATAQRLGDEWLVTSVDPQGVAAHAGLEVGDRVVALDGAPPGGHRRTDPDLDLTVADVWTMDRHGETLSLAPDWGGARWYGTGEPLVLLVIALSFWGLGTAVRLLKREDGLPGAYYRVNLAAAAILALSHEANGDVVWARIAEVVAFSVLPALFLRFCLWFSQDAPPRGRLQAAIYGLFAVGALIGGAYLLTGFTGLDWFYSVRAALMALLAAGVLGGLVALAQAYLYPRSAQTRRQIRVVVFGSSLALIPLVALSVIPISVGLPEVIRAQFAAIGLVFLPLSFAYAILRYRILGIEIVIERTLVSGTMTLLLAGCYALFLYALNLFGRGGGAEPHPLLLLTFFALIALTFVPVREAVNRLIDHLVYHDRYDYLRMLKGLGVQLASAQPLDETLTRLASGLVRAMDLRGVAVLVREPDGELAVRATSGVLPSAAIAGSQAGGAPGLVDGVARGADYGYQVPLVAQGEEMGVLCLGGKKTQAELGAQDLSLIQAVASQAAIAVANALLVERLQVKVAELELLRDRLLHVQEEERKRLAQDIHDGALHSVLDLVRQTEGLIESMPLEKPNHAEVADRFRGLVERGRDAAHELRAVCTDLYPSELVHLGLAAALESLARRISRDENMVVHFSLHGFPMEQRLPEDVEDALYRVAREALDNACRHADASVATVDLGLDGQRVSLVVRDLGRGFIVPARFGAFLRRGHLGLMSIHERIERLGGEFALESAPGDGTTIRVSVPVGREEVGPAPALQLAEGRH